ncbi:MAG: 2-hydroxychromene-2-carboxylate isomerase [Rhodospirillales bacterium]|nr:2-hydroxychromene-2-carboxylate isomerase [Rhodospirillales bacterium]
MSKVIDHYFSITSPWAFLGIGRIIEMAERHDATLVHKPIDLGGKVFPISGGLPLPKRAPQRQAYRLMELKRWRDFLDIPINIQPKFFPASGALAGPVVTAARTRGLDCGKLAQAYLRAVWIEQRNIDDAETVKTIAGEQGMDGDALFSASGSDEIKELFGTDTQEAIDRGVFGAPTYAIGEELWWGQDRLDFVERALAG